MYKETGQNELFGSIDATVVNGSVGGVKESSNVAIKSSGAPSDGIIAPAALGADTGTVNDGRTGNGLVAG